MAVTLVPLTAAERMAWMREMQEAFQSGAETVLGAQEGEVLPQADIERSLQTPGAAAYEARLDGQRVGGALVVIHPESQRNHLDFLYVKRDVQSRGVGQQIWCALEERYPDTVVGETVTPYFEKRNLHFYINCCGFHAVEFYCACHNDPELEEEPMEGAELFRFEKWMDHR